MSRDAEEDQDTLPNKYLPDPDLLEPDEVEPILPDEEDVFYAVSDEGNDPFLERVLYEYVMAEPDNLNINSWLRGEFSHITLESTVSETLQAAQELTKHTEVIDDFIAASEISSPMVVYKGLRRDQITYLQECEVFVPEYISTTTDLGVAEEFACWDISASAEEPNVVLEIHLDPGQYAFYVYVNMRESEYLLPREWFIIIDDRVQVTPHNWRLSCRIRPA